MKDVRVADVTDQEDGTDVVQTCQISDTSVHLHVALYCENFDNGICTALLLGANTSGFRWAQSFVVLCPCVYKVRFHFCSSCFC